jgi:hypothetical protein
MNTSTWGPMVQYALFGFLSSMFDALAFHKFFRDDPPKGHQEAMRWSDAGFIALMASCAALSVNTI